MENKEYLPMPVDIGDIVLADDVLALAELIAKNVHEVWAKNRMEQGWSFGSTRDDSKKQTPCLCRYEDLPESEKLFDRETALSTLRLISKLGYKIIKE